MKHLKTYTIFEKSSLTPIGVPDEVMKEIQINFEIKSNSTWKKMKLKKDIINDLKKNKSFYISFSKYTDNMFIFYSVDKKYYMQYFRFDSNGWGTYEIDNREEISFNNLNGMINIKNEIYKLENSSFKTKLKKQRIVQSQTEKLEKTTESFKYYILKHFNNIVKRMYGGKYYKVMTRISENLSDITNTTSASELLDILTDNKELAKIAAEYEDAMNDDDLLKLKNLEKKYNSLTIIDEYLLMFENEYSEKYSYFVNIKSLIETFGRMQIETAFMFYLYTGRIKELRPVSLKEQNTESDDHHVNQNININNMRPSIDLPMDYFNIPDEDGDNDDDYYSTPAGRDGLYHGTEPGNNKGLKSKNSSIYKMSAESNVQDIMSYPTFITKIDKNMINKYYNEIKSIKNISKLSGMFDEQIDDKIGFSFILYREKIYILLDNSDNIHLLINNQLIPINNDDNIEKIILSEL